MSFFYPHTVSVRDMIANSSRGPKHSPTGRTLAAEVLDKNTLARGDDGEEHVSSAQVTVPLASAVNLGALVTIWPGKAHERESVVLAVERNENAAPLPSYLVLSLK